MSSSDDETRRTLTSGGLVLYDAVSLHERLSQSEDDLPALQRRYRDVGTWKRALTEGFTAACAVGDDTVFRHAIEVLERLPSGPDIESALADIYEAARFVVSRAGLLRQDLSGRIYHSALGRTLAKNFATYYTKLPASDLLAWLAVEEWDDRVADFACGSGTLPNSSYSRKLSIAVPEAIEADDGIDDLDDVHRRFLENDIFGLDAMRFAAHLTMVNLAMQRPMEFESGNIHHVPVGSSEFGTNEVGSLDLLSSNTIDVRRRIDGRDMGADERAVGVGAPDDVTIPRDFDVVIMNPPFTRKDRAAEILDMSRVNELASEHDADVTGQTGLAAPFVLLGDHYLKPGGRLALVLPSAAVDRYSWEPVREMLAENYDVEHMIVSWGAGEPAWSEDSDRREVLIVARKRGGDEDGRSRTIVSHIDEAITFAEARDIAQLLGRTDAANISIRTPNAQVLSSGRQQLGGAKSFPPAFLGDHTDNWYRFAAYRNPDVVRLMLALEGIMSPEESPYGIDLGDVTSQLSDFADVQLFLKNIGPAGYRIVDDEPSGGGDWTVNTSTINRIALSEDDDRVQWVFRDHGLDVTEPFTYDTGELLVTEGGDFYHSMRITATAPEQPATGSVWFPVDVPDLESVDGKRITSNEAGKVVAAWLNSVVGIVPLFGYRAEVRGARGKFKTKQLRRVSVLDPSKLTRKQVDDMLHTYEEVKDTEWELVRTQLEQALEDATHPRRRLDEGVLDALMDEHPDVDALEKDLLDEINRLGRVMNG